MVKTVGGRDDTHGNTVHVTDNSETRFTYDAFRPMKIFCLRSGIVSAASLLSLMPFAYAQTPKSYDCVRAKKPPVIDGKLNDAAWKKASWTDDFVDIEGDAKPKPRFRTRAKILWDDEYLYVGAELEEPEIRATLTEHDSVIFHDNDFELFLKPPTGQPGYFEFEINALNTSWDLYLNKPYSEGGKADNSWNIPGLKTAVALEGTLNNPSDKDKDWTVEIAIPWAAFSSRLPVQRPVAGTEWRVNFSRVEWKAGQKREDNWVWSPQGVINMHVPDKWGYVRFR